MANLHTPTCPFCSVSDKDASFVAEHINFCHPEGGTTQSSNDLYPLQETDLQSSHLVDAAGSDQYIDCPHGCGEAVTAAELSTHLDLHVAEDIALDESGTDSGPFDSDLITSGQDFSSDIEHSLDLPPSGKHAKRGTGRDFARNNSFKPKQARSPTRTIGPDGAKRLGVCLRIIVLQTCANGTE